jgi:hypothetical protein
MTADRESTCGNPRQGNFPAGKFPGPIPRLDGLVGQAVTRDEALEEYARHVVAAWPPLTGDQIDRLVVLLRRPARAERDPGSSSLDGVTRREVGFTPVCSDDA